MKKLLTITLLATLSFAATSSNTTLEKKESNRLCQIFKEKAKSYRETMRDDELAVATLKSYEKRARSFCLATR